MKKVKPTITVMCFLSAMVLGGFCYKTARAQEQIDQAPHASGFGTEGGRIDSQVTLKVPEGHADAVYNYLRSKYAPGKTIIMPQLPGVRLVGQEMSDVSVFTDQYFDTPNLDLYKNKNSVRYRLRINTTHSQDRKNGRELIQVKLTPPGRFDLRNEVKYKVKSTADDILRGGQPFVRLIGGGKRSDFIEMFTKAGIDAYTLQHILTISQTRSRVYVNWGDKNIVSFSVDQGDARILWARGRFASVDVGLQEKTYTEADESKRKIMWQIRDAMTEDLVKRFPELAVNSDSKYSIVLDDIIKQIIYVPTLIKVGVL
jgi:hypothetical protein